MSWRFGETSTYTNIAVSFHYELARDQEWIRTSTNPLEISQLLGMSDSRQSDEQVS